MENPRKPEPNDPLLRRTHAVELNLSVQSAVARARLLRRRFADIRREARETRAAAEALRQRALQERSISDSLETLSGESASRHTKRRGEGSA
jgi:hypothetical protein